MFKNKPVTLIIAAGLMVLLVLIAGVYPLISGGRSLSAGPGRMPISGGNFQPGNMPEGFTPREGAIPPEGGFPQNGGNPGTGPSFQGNNGQGLPGGTMNIRLLQLMRGVQVGAQILVILLGILSVVGIMLRKRWGKVWAIITSVLVLVITGFGMVRIMFGLTLVENVVKVVLAIAIIVLCFLRASRQTLTATEVAPV